MHDTDYAYKATTAEELERLEAMMVNGIRDGGLGFGFGITLLSPVPREKRSSVCLRSRSERMSRSTCTFGARTLAARWVRFRK